jgi:glycine cleavage system H protein
MNIPETLRYATTHEWVRQEADGTLTVGVSDFAQDNLGELVFIELPQIGRQVAAEEGCAVVESVKAASDIYAPVAGEVTAVNAELADTPKSVNQDPYGAWLFRLKPAADADLGKLMDAAAYRAQLGPD